ncbi:hypothetical protein H7I76_34680, partial [Mycolicibacterium vaccae]|nr:hypothetical protein [Mycolicibacterium vaccae]
MLIAAAVAAGIIAFLIAGMGGFINVANAAYIGGLTGIVKRRRRGTPTVVVASFVAGVVFGAAVVGALAVLTRLRQLIFDAITANVDGVAGGDDAGRSGASRRAVQGVFRHCAALLAVAGAGQRRGLGD